MPVKGYYGLYTVYILHSCPMVHGQGSRCLIDCRLVEVQLSFVPGQGEVSDGGPLSPGQRQVSSGHWSPVRCLVEIL